MSKEFIALEKMYKRLLYLSNLINHNKTASELGINSVTHYLTVKNALTPPTEEEVCKALSEYLKGKVIYKNSDFYVVGDDWKEFLIGLTKDEKGNYVIDFWVDNFPPHIVIMVGRFYEGKNG